MDQHDIAMVLAGLSIASGKQIHRPEEIRAQNVAKDSGLFFEVLRQKKEITTRNRHPVSDP